MSVPVSTSSGNGRTHIGEGERDEHKLVEQGEPEVEHKVQSQPVRRALCERHLGGVHCGRRAVLRVLAAQGMVHGGCVRAVAPPGAGEVRGLVRVRRRGRGRRGLGGRGPAGGAVLRGHDPAARLVRLQADRGGHGGRTRLRGGAGGLCDGETGRKGAGAGRSGRGQ